MLHSPSYFVNRFPFSFLLLKQSGRHSVIAIPWYQTNSIIFQAINHAFSHQSFVIFSQAPNSHSNSNKSKLSSFGEATLWAPNCQNTTVNQTQNQPPIFIPQLVVDSPHCDPRDTVTQKMSSSWYQKMTSLQSGSSLPACAYLSRTQTISSRTFRSNSSGVTQMKSYSRRLTPFGGSKSSVNFVV